MTNEESETKFKELMIGALREWERLGGHAHDRAGTAGLALGLVMAILKDLPPDAQLACCAAAKTVLDENLGNNSEMMTFH